MAYETAVELLVGLLGAGEDRVQAGALARLLDGDWDELARQAIAHGVAPLVHRRLEMLASGVAMPENVRQVLRGYYLQTALRNARLYGCLAKLLEVFREAAIEVIVLKGAALAGAVYGNVALRSMGDIDLLVRTEDLLKVEALLLKDRHGPRQRPSLAQQRNSGLHLVPFMLGSTKLEVHWTIEEEESPFRVDTDGLWKRARPFRLADQPALMLSLEDLLLHLCLHTTYNHGWLMFESGLRAFCDISEVIRRYGGELDWEMLRRRASLWGIDHCVYLTLQLTRNLLGSEIPDGILGALRPSQFDEKWISWARDLVFSRHYRIFESELPIIAQLWLSKRSYRSGRATRILKGFFPSRRTLANSYPSIPEMGFGYLSYPARWADLALECGRLFVLRSGKTEAILQREHRRVVMMRWLEDCTVLEETGG